MTIKGAGHGSELHDLKGNAEGLSYRSRDRWEI